MATTSTPVTGDATEESAPTSSQRGALSFSSRKRPRSAAAPIRERGGDEELRAAWEAFGRPRGYEGAEAQELKDAEDPRNRGRGERTRHKRLARGWKQLEREMAAAAEERQELAEAERTEQEAAAHAVQAAAQAEAEARRAALEARVAERVAVAERAERIFAAFNARLRADGSAAVDELVWFDFLPWLGVELDELFLESVDEYVEAYGDWQNDADGERREWEQRADEWDGESGDELPAERADPSPDAHGAAASPPPPADELNEGSADVHYESMDLWLARTQHNMPEAPPLTEYVVSDSGAPFLVLVSASSEAWSCWRGLLALCLLNTHDTQ